ncbi:MAG: Kojibiose phosphorylase [Ramlibacter sp.]|nr:Kojibiose phosphorylase [Ramlibacter sp.]
MQLCPEAFTAQQKARNFAYYERITVPDSSLSAATQAVLAAETGHLALAYDYLCETALLDLGDLAVTPSTACTSQRWPAPGPGWSRVSAVSVIPSPAWCSPLGCPRRCRGSRSGSGGMVVGCLWRSPPRRCNTVCWPAKNSSSSPNSRTRRSDRRPRSAPGPCRPRRPYAVAPAPFCARLSGHAGSQSGHGDVRRLRVAVRWGIDVRGEVVGMLLSRTGLASGRARSCGVPSVTPQWCRAGRPATRWRWKRARSTPSRFFGSRTPPRGCSTPAMRGRRYGCAIARRRCSGATRC